MWGFKDITESRYFLASKIILGFLCPLLVIMYCYVNIMLVVRRSENRLKNGTKKPQSSVSIRTERAIAVVISVFFCTWLPNHVFNFGKLKSATVSYSMLQSATVYLTEFSINFQFHWCQKSQVRRSYQR